MAAEGRRLFYVEEKLWPDYRDDDGKRRWKADSLFIAASLQQYFVSIPFMLIYNFGSAAWENP